MKLYRDRTHEIVSTKSYRAVPREINSKRTFFRHRTPLDVKKKVLLEDAAGRLRRRGREAGAADPPVPPPRRHPHLHDGPGGHRDHLRGGDRLSLLLLLL